LACWQPVAGPPVLTGAQPSVRRVGR
jgi:hypothetical protein